MQIPLCARSLPSPLAEHLSLQAIPCSTILEPVDISLTSERARIVYFAPRLPGMGYPRLRVSSGEWYLIHCEQTLPAADRRIEQGYDQPQGALC